MRILTAAILFVFMSYSLAQARMVSITGKEVNMRSGPGIGYAIRWELSKGYPLLVLETRGGWLKVRDFENDVGWVFRSLTGRKPHLIVKKSRVNIRSGPGSRYKIIGKAEYGVVLQTLAQKQGWAKVIHENGLAGWIKRDLLWGW